MLLRKRIYQIVALSDTKDRAGLLFDAILYATIIINIILYAWQSLYHGTSEMLLLVIYESFYRISLLFYLTEWLIRMWVCVEDKSYSDPVIGRLRFLLHPLTIIDAIVLLSFVLFGTGSNIIFIRSIRLFNLSKYIGEKNDYSPYQLLKRSIWNKKEELLITLFGALITLIICSYIIYYVEKNAQPEIMHSITPSIKWTFSVLTNTATENFEPVTSAGKLLHMTMTIIGVLIIGLPLGIITGGFISEIEDSKKSIQLRKNASILIKAFSREGKIPVRTLVEELKLTHDARRIDLDLISARLQFSQNEIFETVRSSGSLRIRACRSSKEMIFEDNLILEQFPANSNFGVKQVTQNGIHVIATQNYSDPGIGHYSRQIANALQASYYSNEYFSSADMLPEKRINFAVNPDYHTNFENDESPFGEWKKCIFQEIKKEDLVIYVGTAGSKSGADFHVVCGGPKGAYLFSTLDKSTVTDTQTADDFFESFKKECSTLDLSIFRQENFPNTSQDHCAWALRNTTGANILTIYVNIEFLQFAEYTSYYKSVRLLADNIVKHFLQKRA